MNVLTENKMSEAAKQNDASIAARTVLVDVSKIYLDHDFNCRLAFIASSCRELAEDIAKRGLQQAVIVRGCRPEGKHEMESEHHLIERGFTHVMIAGHRRLTAYKINNAEQIPCIIKDAYTPDFDCHDINAIENLQREELNLFEEAQAIKHYWMANWTREEVAERVKKSSGWVQVRFMLLGFDDRIQDLAKQGLLKTKDIRELNSYRDPTDRLKAAGQIRDARKKEKKGGKPVAHIRRPDSPTKKKHRGRDELFEMQTRIRSLCRQIPQDGFIDNDALFSPGGNSLTTKVLGWAAGELTAFEVHHAIKEFATAYKLHYDMPEFSNDL